MSKTLLIISGDAAAAGTARRIKALGHTLVVCDPDPQAPAFAFADSCLIADCRAPADCAAAAERYSRKIRRIEGVLSLSDTPLTGAAVAERLRLPGLPQHVAELTDDRLRLKRAFASAGIPGCWHAEIFTPQELQRAAIARGSLVIKPVERRGDGHDRRLNGADDLAALFQAARAASPTQRVMIEQYPQPLRIDAFVEDGEIQGPAEWRDVISRAASALDLREGPLTLELAMQDSSAALVDASPHLSPDSEFLEAAIRLATSAR
jgi:phosphoribosylaminoimidazole carboxylase (NCAIR synthetase)